MSFDFTGVFDGEIQGVEIRRLEDKNFRTIKRLKGDLEIANEILTELQEEMKDATVSELSDLRSVTEPLEDAVDALRGIADQMERRMRRKA